MKELTETLEGARGALTAPNHGIDEALATEILEHIGRFEAMLDNSRVKRDELAWHALQLGRLLAEPMVEEYFHSVDGGRGGGNKTANRYQNKYAKEVLEFIKEKYDKGGFRDTYGNANLTDAVATKFGLSKGRAAKWVRRALKTD
jgi:hypothetical protein